MELINLLNALAQKLFCGQVDNQIFFLIKL